MTSVHPSSPKPAFQRFLLSFFTAPPPPPTPPTPPPLSSFPLRPVSSRLIRAGGARFSPGGSRRVKDWTLQMQNNVILHSVKRVPRCAMVPCGCPSEPSYTLSIKDPAAPKALFHHRTRNVSRAAAVMARDLYLKHLSIDFLLGTRWHQSQSRKMFHQVNIGPRWYLMTWDELIFMKN